MVVILKPKAHHVGPSMSTIRHRAAAIRREWSAHEHYERCRLAEQYQRLLYLEVGSVLGATVG